MNNSSSRTQKSVLNAKVNLLFFIFNVIIAFYSRKIFIDTLGVDFVGLTSIIFNILSFLNVAECGIGAAVAYRLYKPLKDNDIIEINCIVSALQYTYRWIGFIILMLGLALLLFVGRIFNEVNYPIELIIFAYFSFLLPVLLSYFINFRQVLLEADQKTYLVTISYKSLSIFKSIIQICLCMQFMNAYLWCSIEIVFSFLATACLFFKVKKVYPWLHSSISKGKKYLSNHREIFHNTKRLFVHQLAGLAQYQTIPVFIYAFCSIQLVTIYTSYTLITNNLASFISSLYSGSRASIGNLIVEGDKEKILSVFWQAMTLRMLVAISICFCSKVLINDFIVLWLGNDFLLDNTTVNLLLLNLYISLTRGTLDDFNFGYGLFWDVFAPLSETILCLSLAYFLGNKFGLDGILCSSVCVLFLVCFIWKPILLFKFGFYLPTFVFFKGFIYRTFVGLIVFFLTNELVQYLTENFTLGLFNLTCKAFIAFILITVTSLTFFNLLNNDVIFLFRRFILPLKKYLIK